MKDKKTPDWKDYAQTTALSLIAPLRMRVGIEGNKNQQIQDAFQTLTETVAERLAFWMEEAARNAGNTSFYRDLLDECAKYLGPEVFVADDKSVMDEPVRLKIPQLVAQRQETVREVARMIRKKYLEISKHGIDRFQVISLVNWAHSLDPNPPLDPSYTVKINEHNAGVDD